MASGEVKVSVMTFLDTVPDDAKIYVVKPGDTTPYYTTKAALLAGISGASTPGINAVLTVSEEVTTKDQIFRLTATEFLKINRAAQRIEFWDTAIDAVNPVSILDSTKIYFKDSAGNEINIGSGYNAWNYADGSGVEFFGGGTIRWTDGITENTINIDSLVVNGVVYALPSGSASQIATKLDIDNKVAGLLDLRGSHDCSGNAFPTTGGSGTSGAILKGDFWYVSVAGTLNGVAVNVGDSFFALNDSPTSGQWQILESNLGYVSEDAANKTDTMSGNTASSTKYLSAKGVYDYLIGMTWLTDTIFGTWSNDLTGKTTPVDADTVNIVDSADSNKSKKLSLTNFFANYLKSKTDALYQTKSEVMKLTSAYTLASSTSLQKLFNVGSGSGGAYNAAANRTIRFRIEFDLSGMSSTSGTFSFGILGTAGIASISYEAVASKASTTLAGTANATIVNGTTSNAVVLVAATTNTVGKAVIAGTIVTSTAGTIILSTATSVATGSCQVGVNSYAEFTDIGPDTLTATSNIT